jgi:hypothetical protein
MEGALDDLDPAEVDEVMAAFAEAIESGELLELS